ncbi:hypothetical protein AVEN_191095-1 [Araneus ventricosus]|uniref:Uncharacterized protein n=1 Tax=Araneus ventricosus TaxID=182803 RepID=A0A4Y2AZX5_ARAVE|nr:hypothetical protein AVEN_191095-1 [Araneus ventricosus]
MPEGLTAENTEKSRNDYENQNSEVKVETCRPENLKVICTEFLDEISICKVKFGNLLAHNVHLRHFTAEVMSNVPLCSYISETRDECKNHSKCDIPEIHKSCDWEKCSVTNQLKNQPKSPLDLTVDENNVEQVKTLHKSDPLNVEEDFSHSRFCDYKSCDRNTLENYMFSMEMRMKKDLKDKIAEKSECKCEAMDASEILRNKKEVASNGLDVVGYNSRGQMNYMSLNNSLVIVNLHIRLESSFR